MCWERWTWVTSFPKENQLLGKCRWTDVKKWKFFIGTFWGDFFYFGTFWHHFFGRVNEYPKPYAFKPIWKMELAKMMMLMLIVIKGHNNGHSNNLDQDCPHKCSIITSCFLISLLFVCSSFVSLVEVLCLFLCTLDCRGQCGKSVMLASTFKHF